MTPSPRVRRALGTKKVGHAGTLDPMATGLLVMGVGRATRLLRFLGDLPKTLRGRRSSSGSTTTTLDADGEVVARAATSAVTRDDVAAAMAAKLGASAQRPPAFSAVKVGGRKLHEAARAGEPIEAPARIVRVDRFDLLAMDGDAVRFAATVSGGTYVRVLAADVGDALGVGAHLTALRRTAIGAFDVADARPPDDPGTPLPVATAVAHLPRVDLDAVEAEAAGHGRVLGPAGVEGPVRRLRTRGRADRDLAGRRAEGQARDGARAGARARGVGCLDGERGRDEDRGRRTGAALRRTTAPIEDHLGLEADRRRRHLDRDRGRDLRLRRPAVRELRARSADVLTALTWLEIGALVLATVFNLVTYWWANQAALPGLGIGKAATVTQATTAVANTLPAGGAVAIGLTYAMLDSWGFSGTNVALFVGVTGIWNIFTKLGLPLLALGILAVTGHATPTYVVGAVDRLDRPRGRRHPAGPPVPQRTLRPGRSATGSRGSSRSRAGGCASRRSRGGETPRRSSAPTRWAWCIAAGSGCRGRRCSARWRCSSCC